MKPYFLLPGYFKVIGWLLLVPGLILGWLFLFLHFELTVANRRYKMKLGSSDFTNELALTLVLLGLYSIIYAKRKNECDVINRIRLNALWGAFLINYITVGLMILLQWFSVTNVEVYNLFSMPLIALIIFEFQLFAFRRKAVFKPIRLLKFYPYQIIATVAILITAILSSVVYYLSGESYQFLLLPILVMFWICCAEREEDAISQSRLKIIRNLFALQLLVILLSNFYLYQLDFWLFMVINLFAMPVLYLLIHKACYQVKIKKIKMSNILDK